MHGFGPASCTLEANGTRAPSITTIRAHVFELRRLGLVHSEGRRHWRLVDSVLDAATGLEA